jgi:hypothetical protein
VTLVGEDRIADNFAEDLQCTLFGQVLAQVVAQALPIECGIDGYELPRMAVPRGREDLTMLIKIVSYAFRFGSR